MKTTLWITACLITFSFISNRAYADANDKFDVGSLVSRCTECHSEKGESAIPGWPSIAGMDKEIIVAKLKGHRAGLVNDSTMKKVAHDLSDGEINAVAEHFSSMLPPVLLNNKEPHDPRISFWPPFFVHGQGARGHPALTL